MAAESVRPIAALPTTVIAVKTSRYRSRPPVRSLIAPSTGETSAFTRTLAAPAKRTQNWPSAGPSRSTAHRPIAYDTIA